VAFRQLLDSSPSAALPLSYLVEIVSERDAQLIEDLREAVESKRRELRKSDLFKNDSRKKLPTDRGREKP
jgi:hypothetical protein